MPNIQQRTAILDHRTDAVLSSFDNRLSSILSSAQARTIVQLRGNLDIEAHHKNVVKATAKNIRTIRGLPATFQQALKASGYDDLLAGFAHEFDGGLPTLDSILSEVSNAYQIEPVTFTAADLAYFDELKTGAILNIQDAVMRTAQVARQNTLFTMGGQPFVAVAATIAERLHVALGEASTMAATGISTFYRTIAANGYTKIQDVLEGSGKELEYMYVGPPASDKLIRPFCARLMTQVTRGRVWTRDQIEAMDNGQLPDVMTTGGGYNCRHQWVVSLDQHLGS